MTVFKSYKSLIFVPTYNERENVEILVSQLDQLNLGFDYLFIDDNSPDKTGDLLDQMVKTRPNLNVIHRPRKLGIGSAHVDGIEWAYQNNYQVLITMDSDFSHSPLYILKLLEYSESSDVVVGSRYMQKNSLSEWNFRRKFLTHMGHFMTKKFFNMPYDATGAFRLYRLDKIPSKCFGVERSQGYSFFFESLFILFRNHFKITEVAIDLPARTYGQSKMKFKDAVYSLTLLLKMVLLNIFKPDVFLINQSDKKILQNTAVNDDQGWDEYWEKQQSVNNWFYDHIAEFFRQFIIKPYLNKYIYKYFPKGVRLLHAGCGSGQVDRDITNEYPVIAMDISLNALNIYRKGHSQIEELIQGDIRKMDLENESVDGIYSLGVMEHFYETDILLILNEFRRVLRTDGKLVLFWPPKFGLSVFFLKTWHFFVNKVFKKNIRLHPHEVSLLESKEQILSLANRTGYSLVEYHFGLNDLFTQVVVVLKK